MMEAAVPDGSTALCHHRPLSCARDGAGGGLAVISPKIVHAD